MAALLVFLHDNLWILVLAMLLSIGSLLLLPFAVIWLPADYFLLDRRQRFLRERRHPLVAYALLLVKNGFALVLLLLGIAMLVLPGQGLLTMCIALMLMDFPGKYRLERWLVSRRKVLDGLNWLRARRGREPFLPPPRDEAPRA
ncbi:MAG: hypothetical protein LBF16_10095 [Pseudomonadales bacterium]|nr:hypothetical protein [Pseudomonadales bacterium]